MGLMIRQVTQCYSRLDRQSSRPNLLFVTEEIFDVVDGQDEVIGRATRNEVHRRGLMHRATHVLVFNSAGQVFLQKRSMNKDRQPGLWDSSASGHLNVSEGYDACGV